jgi:DNA repair exonuclease SbcCD ATPase subunit
MIKSVELVNFEAHKHNFLEFDKGLNVFKGSSGAGKSSIKRGIMWVLTNRPSANQVVSWWAVNQKGKQTDETRVTITLDNGTTISRIKSDTLNGYQINDDKPLEAVGTSVPEEVSKLLNMSDVNHQIQLAAPFLISQSASYVAQYINDIVDMSEADRYQSSVEAKRRKCNADLVANTEAIKNTTEELTHFYWLEEAEKCIKRIERVGTEYEKLLTDYKTIDDLAIGKYREQVKKLESCAVIPVAGEKVDKIINLLDHIDFLSVRKLSLSDSIKNIRSYETAIADGVVVDMAEKLVRRIERMLGEQEELTIDSGCIAELVKRYRDTVEVLKDITEELDVEERSFSQIDICPACKQKIPGHICTF